MNLIFKSDLYLWFISFTCNSLPNTPSLGKHARLEDDFPTTVQGLCGGRLMEPHVQLQQVRECVAQVKSPQSRPAHVHHYILLRLVSTAFLPVPTNSSSLTSCATSGGSRDTSSVTKEHWVSKIAHFKGELVLVHCLSYVGFLTFN